MEQLLEIFKGLTAFQWVLLGVGAFLIWPVIRDYFSTPSVPSIPDEIDVEPKKDLELTELIKRWELLYSACDSQKLSEACSKLKEVLPMLVKSREV